MSKKIEAAKRTGAGVKPRTLVIAGACKNL
jgi:hypothetical protein